MPSETTSHQQVVHPYVESYPNVQGGRSVIKGTRFPVSSIVQNHRRGISVDEILREFPQLTPAKSTTRYPITTTTRIRSNANLSSYLTSKPPCTNSRQRSLHRNERHQDVPGRRRTRNDCTCTSPAGARCINNRRGGTNSNRRCGPNPIRQRARL
ncbi:MAG: hypothetical protein CMJ64_10880 [Planctomycetaceae bacterium]|nr:hypothetical protein [Planctomycetaceae bacterium]